MCRVWEKQSGESDKISSYLRDSYLAMVAKKDQSLNKTVVGKGEEVDILSLFMTVLFPIMPAATACNIKVKSIMNLL